MKKYFNYGLLLFSLSLQIPAQAFNDVKINALAEDFLEKNQVPGMSIAVIDQNKIHFYNLGWADPLKKFPLAIKRFTPSAPLQKPLLPHSRRGR